MKTRKDKVDVDRQTSQNGNRIVVVIDGVNYESIADTSRKLGMSYATVEVYLRDGQKKSMSGLVFVLVIITVIFFFFKVKPIECTNRCF